MFNINHIELIQELESQGTGNSNVLVLDIDNVNSQDTKDIKEITEWEVWTPSGWSDFKQIKKITKPYYYYLEFGDKSNLKCSPYHKIKLQNNSFKYTIKLKKGDITSTGLVITKIKKINKKIELFDLLGVEKGAEYYTNGIISSNCAAITHMEEIWASAGITLTRSKGKCIGISCVTDDTFVFTNQGIKQIKNFVNYNEDITQKQNKVFRENYKVLGNNQTFKTGNLFHYNGNQDIYELTTCHSSIKGSFNHKLWVYDNATKEYKWKKLGEITTEDSVNIQYGMNIWGDNDDVSTFDPKISPNHKNIFIPKKLTPDICYLIGLYIAEGYAAPIIKNHKEIGGCFNISCGDNMEKAFTDVGLPCYMEKQNIGHRTGSWTLVQFLQHLGFDLSLKAPKKTIPIRLFECSKENIKALLQGMFDGDGSSNSQTGTVSYVSSSRELINQVKILLLNFGIWSSIFKTKVEDLNKNLPEGWYKFTGDSYSIQIYSKQAEKFYKEIGFRLERKQKNLSKLKITKGKDNTEIPNSKDIINNLYRLTTLTPYKLATCKKIYIPKDKSSPSHRKDKILQLISLIIKENPALSTHFYIRELLDKVLIPNSKWCKVKSINKLLNKEPVFDFSLPNNKEDFWCHSVLYNGILGHQTPKGQAGFYFEQYTHAQENGWNIIDAHWSENPEYSKGMYQWIKDDVHPQKGYIKHFNNLWPDISTIQSLEKYKTKETYNYIIDGKLRSPWYDVESKKLGLQKTKCELDCSFAGSGGEVIDPEVIRSISVKAKEYPALANYIKKGGPYKFYKQFKEYDRTHMYLISCDVATGDGSDFSAFSVIDINTKEVVVTYKDQIETTVFSKIIYDTANRFGKCLVIVEHQGPGLAVLMELKNHLQYNNIYYHTMKKQEVTKPQKRKIGFWQGENTRTLGLDKLEEVINSGEIKIYSEDVISELYTWIWDKDGKRRHAPGKHDDLLMSLSMGVFYIYFVLVKRDMNRNMMRDHFQIIKQGTDPSSMFF